MEPYVWARKISSSAAKRMRSESASGAELGQVAESAGLAALVRALRVGRAAQIDSIADSFQIAIARRGIAVVS